LGDRDTAFTDVTNPRHAHLHVYTNAHRFSVTVSRLWNLIKKGHSRKHIKRILPGVKSTHLDAAESFMMERQRNKYEEVFGQPKTFGRESRPFNIWIDECVPWRQGSKIHKAGFGRVKSVVLNDKNGTKDPYLWRYLIRKQADLIITRDGCDFEHPDDETGMRLNQLSTQHLTTLAQKSREHSLCAQWHRGKPITGKKLPLLLIVDHSVTNKALPDLLRKHRSHIIRSIKGKKDIVYITLTNKGIGEVRRVEDIHYDKLAPLALHAMREAEKKGYLPFAPPDRTDRTTIAKKQRYETDLQVYQTKRETLMEAVLGHAMRNNIFAVDAELVKDVILMTHGYLGTDIRPAPKPVNDEAPSIREYGSSQRRNSLPAPNAGLSGSARPRRASLG